MFDPGAVVNAHLGVVFFMSNVKESPYFLSSSVVQPSRPREILDTVYIILRISVTHGTIWQRVYPSLLYMSVFDWPNGPVELPCVFVCCFFAPGHATRLQVVVMWL